MTHTPGPWKAWDDDGTGTLPCVLSDQVTAFGNFYVAQCNVYNDARLIAAAPDQNDALVGLVDLAESMASMLNSLGYPAYYADAKPRIDSARTAIAKATQP